jgi:hypothetical protein
MRYAVGFPHANNTEIKALCFERAHKAYSIVFRYHRRAKMHYRNGLGINLKIESARKNLVLVGEELAQDRVRWDLAGSVPRAFSTGGMPAAMQPASV